MKHAGAASLDRLELVLAELRSLPGLRERSRGVFYRKGRAFLHFHEDPEGLFADIRQAVGDDFERIDVTGGSGRGTLIAAARERSA